MTWYIKIDISRGYDNTFNGNIFCLSFVVGVSYIMSSYNRNMCQLKLNENVHVLFVWKGY